ncbi:hypothetical protein [Saccharopolyspora shandongensis]|uniref:hypothetical protein n=1 Tax=Saccharopolyspora shandongensis TaxID=418495 RepID=UPI0033EDA6C3
MSRPISTGRRASTGSSASCTLHFVSASGSEAEPGEERFARGFEPVRVLEPLVAILAMAGMIGGEPAGRVGT